MLTQFFRSINWVDVALFVLLARIIFVSVKTGFVIEVFKLFGIICALFVSLHYYAFLAASADGKTSLPLNSWQFIAFVSLAVVVYMAIKYLRDGILVVFKVETTHQGFNKYAAGLLSGVRTVFTASLVIFALLLINHSYVHRQVLSSWSFKVAGHAAPNAYRFIYQKLVMKLFDKQKFNDNVFVVTSGHGINPK